MSSPTTRRPTKSHQIVLDDEMRQFYRPVKALLSTRIDADVLAWLRAQGDGYQSRLNAILREAMEKELRTK